MNHIKSFLSKNKGDIIIIAITVSLAIMFSINFSILFVNGDSMSPTYEDNNILVVKKSNLNKNEIVVFESPESWSSQGKNFIKRIIAEEGDILSISNDELKVNNVLINEIQAKNCRLGKEIEVVVGKDEYFMVGDNYNSSNDSLTQLCRENEEFLIKKENILFSGKEVILLKGGFLDWL